MALKHLITDVVFFHLLNLDTRGFVVDSVEGCFADFAKAWLVVFQCYECDFVSCGVQTNHRGKRSFRNT